MKFREAIRSATIQSMENDPNVFLIGVGIIDPRAVWGTLSGTIEKFGRERVIEGPLAEDALTGICVGAATLGMRPMIIHHRIDFVLLTLNQLINHAAKWRDMFGKQQTTPMVVRAVVGRGWGNGPQHTQSLHSLFSHFPGIKVVVPTNPKDAKGLLLSAVADDEPVIFIEHRWFHEDEQEVPDEYYLTPLGQAAIAKIGSDLTIVAAGPMVTESLKAASALTNQGLSAEVIDLRTLYPLDISTIIESVKKTGRLLVADSDWSPCGIASEVITSVVERGLDLLKAPPIRITWPHICVPSSQAIESMFYPGAAEIQAAALKICTSMSLTDLVTSTIKSFDGPF